MISILAVNACNTDQISNLILYINKYISQVYKNNFTPNLIETNITRLAVIKANSLEDKIFKFKKFPI